MTDCEKKVCSWRVNLMAATKSLLLFRGFILVLLGTLIMLQPLLTLLGCTILLGVVIAIHGFRLLFTVGRVSEKMRTWQVFYAIMSLITGMLMVALPLYMDWLWMMIFGFYLIIDGIEMFYLGIKGLGASRFLTFVSAVLSMFLGLVLFATPLAGMAVIAWSMGIIILCYGVLMLVGSIMIPKAIDDDLGA